RSRQVHPVLEAPHPEVAVALVRVGLRYRARADPQLAVVELHRDLLRRHPRQPRLHPPAARRLGQVHLRSAVAAADQRRADQPPQLGAECLQLAEGIPATIGLPTQDRHRTTPCTPSDRPGPRASRARPPRGPTRRTPAASARPARSELDASNPASGSTPTPSRSTSSPPNQAPSTRPPRATTSIANRPPPAPRCSAPVRTTQ